MNDAKRYVIYKVCGRLSGWYENIRKGCLIEAQKPHFRDVEILQEFTNKEEALAVFSGLNSMFHLYSRRVFYIEEYELREIFYETELVMASHRIAVSDFIYPEWFSRKTKEEKLSEDFKVKYETLTGEIIVSEYTSQKKALKLFNKVKNDVKWVELIYSPIYDENTEDFDENVSDDGNMVIQEQTNKVIDVLGQKFISKRNIYNT